MKTLVSDPPLNFKKCDHSLNERRATYVDDKLHPGNGIYSGEYRKTEKMLIERNKNGTILNL